MNKKIATTSLIAIASVVTLSQAASAQDGNPNRFHFPPSTYAEEHNGMHHPYEVPAPPSNVRAGAVPHNLLGADPGFLSRPAPPPQPAMRVAPIATRNVTPTIGFTNAVPTAMPAATPAPSLPAQFLAQYGKPLNVVAHTPTPASPLAQAKSEPAKPSSRPSHSGHSSHCTGVLRTPRLPAALAAKPAQGISNYGSQGYQSGTYTPTAGSTGSGSNTSVSGTLMHRH